MKTSAFVSFILLSCVVPFGLSRIYGRKQLNNEIYRYTGMDIEDDRRYHDSPPADSDGIPSIPPPPPPSTPGSSPSGEEEGEDDDETSQAQNSTTIQTSGEEEEETSQARDSTTESEDETTQDPITETPVKEMPEVTPPAIPDSWQSQALAEDCLTNRPSHYHTAGNDYEDFFWNGHDIRHHAIFHTGEKPPAWGALHIEIAQRNHSSRSYSSKVDENGNPERKKSLPSTWSNAQVQAYFDSEDKKQKDCDEIETGGGSGGGTVIEPVPTTTVPPPTTVTPPITIRPPGGRTDGPTIIKPGRSRRGYRLNLHLNINARGRQEATQPLPREDLRRQWVDDNIGQRRQRVNMRERPKYSMGYRVNDDYQYHRGAYQPSFLPI